MRVSNCWLNLWKVNLFTAAYYNMDSLCCCSITVKSLRPLQLWVLIHFIWSHTHTPYIDLMKTLWLENSNMWQGEDSAMPRRCMWKVQTSGHSLKNTAFWLVNFYGVIYHPVGTAVCITRRSERRKWHANVLHSLLYPRSAWHYFLFKVLHLFLSNALRIQ